MMAKIVKGSDFKGVVNYILDKEKNAQVIAFEGLFMENKDTIAMSFNTQSQMNNKVSKPVGHIALSFSKEDEPRLTNRVMASIALEYIERMGIRDTQFFIARHFDKHNFGQARAFAQYPCLQGTYAEIRFVYGKRKGQCQA